MPEGCNEAMALILDLVFWLRVGGRSLLDQTAAQLLNFAKDLLGVLAADADRTRVEFTTGALSFR